MSAPNQSYKAGQNWDKATPINSPSFSAPFPGVNVNYLLKQDFMQNAADFLPLTLNTQHPDFPDFVLVEEPDKPDQGALVFRWTRTYAKIPTSYTEPGGTYGYTFIGFEGQNQVAGPTVVFSYTGRERFTRPVQVQVTKDFYIVGDILDKDGNVVTAASATPADPTGPYEEWEQIPSIEALRYFITLSGSGQELDIDYINEAAVSLNKTTPSRETYVAMMDADAADQSSYSLEVETSTLTRQWGNIFLRERKRVKAL